MSTRAAGIPIESLPYVDEHFVEIGTDAEAAWAALLDVLSRSFAGGLAPCFTRLLGCEATDTRGELTAIGATLPGFVVVRSTRPVLLALEGGHRFSRYALVFRIERLRGGRSLLRAETRAEFPGAMGRVYRMLVIGTSGHLLVVRRLLRMVRSRAERMQTA